MRRPNTNGDSNNSSTKLQPKDAFSHPPLDEVTSGKKGPRKKRNFPHWTKKRKKIFSPLSPFPDGGGERRVGRRRCLPNQEGRGRGSLRGKGGGRRGSIAQFVSRRQRRREEGGEDGPKKDHIPYTLLHGKRDGDRQLYSTSFPSISFHIVKKNREEEEREVRPKKSHGR